MSRDRPVTLFNIKRQSRLSSVVINNLLSLVSARADTGQRDDFRTSTGERVGETGSASSSIVQTAD